MSVPEFKDFIETSPLSDDLKGFWQRAFGFMSDEECGIAARFVDGNQRTLMFYTDTLHRKYQAFMHHDRAALDGVLNDEKQMLSV